MVDGGLAFLATIEEGGRILSGDRNTRGDRGDWFEFYIGLDGRGARSNAISGWSGLGDRLVTLRASGGEVDDSGGGTSAWSRIPLLYVN